MLDHARLNRIRWRARRGLLENDIILEKFFNQQGDALTENDVVGLDALLELSDNDLFDLVMARKELVDVQVAPQVLVPTAQVLSILRSIH